MEAVDKSPEQMLAMFDELDHDKSDTVGFGEFCDCERQRSLLEIPEHRVHVRVAHEFAAVGVAKKHVTQQTRNMFMTQSALKSQPSGFELGVFISSLQPASGLVRP